MHHFRCSIYHPFLSTHTSQLIRYMHTYNTYIRVHIYTYTYTPGPFWISHMNIYICMYDYICIYIHIYTPGPF